MQLTREKALEEHKRWRAILDRWELLRHSVLVSKKECVAIIDVMALAFEHATGISHSGKTLFTWPGGSVTFLDRPSCDKFYVTGTGEGRKL